jgi:ABC-type multidrug transport system fused ATPase/permease subunit
MVTMAEAVIGSCTREFPSHLVVTGIPSYGNGDLETYVVERNLRVERAQGLLAREDVFSYGDATDKFIEHRLQVPDLDRFGDEIVFALTGAVKNVGLVEVPMGMTINEVVYGIGGYLVILGTFTVGTIVAFGAYLTSLYSSLDSVLMNRGIFNEPPGNLPRGNFQKWPGNMIERKNFPRSSGKKLANWDLSDSSSKRNTGDKVWGFLNTRW